MYKWIGLILSLLSVIGQSASRIPIKDNNDIALTLSQDNYNRIVILNDKIIEAVFPSNAMAIKRDEQDGSVYVMLSTNNPFTLFLTTEGGRHFSVTLNGEPALGKTIELVPEKATIAKKAEKAVIKNVATTEEAVPEAILAMLSHMEQHKPFADVKILHQYGKAERWGKGLTLLPKEVWDGKLLKGETIELYNASKDPLELSQEWFTQEQTLAVKFSKLTLNPGERGMLYRIQGVKNG
jgi:conjugal transfer pilus assembly protein TraK